MSSQPDPAVIVVDLQADFTMVREGALAVTGTEQDYLDRVSRAVGRLRDMGLPVYATQDWHPPDHVSFASNHKGRAVFDTVELADGRTQTLWPDHAVQGSAGAEILLDVSLFAKVVRKGAYPRYDSYSGFQDDSGRKTGLEEILRAAGARTVLLFGLAVDYCLKATVCDALEAGFGAVVVKDLCRGVDPAASEAAWAEMEAKGARIWPSLDIERVKEL